jgi:hypothetical protein
MIQLLLGYSLYRVFVKLVLYYLRQLLYHKAEIAQLRRGMNSPLANIRHICILQSESRFLQTILIYFNKKMHLFLLYHLSRLSLASIE